MEKGKIDGFTQELYARLYRKSPVAVDCLPYTDHLDWITRIVQHITDERVMPADVFRNLVSLRKCGTLDLKGKSQRKAKDESGFTDDDIALIGELYDGQSLVADKLPYTDEFERMFAEFHGRSRTTTTRALFFCAVVNKRKKGELARKHRRLLAGVSS